MRPITIIYYPNGESACTINDIIYEPKDYINMAGITYDGWRIEDEMEQSYLVRRIYLITIKK